MTQDVGSIIALIMERPDLLAEIKKLAESGEAAKEEIKEESDVGPDEPEHAAVIKTDEVKPQRPSGKSRGDLVRALSPFISKERQKAMETFLTIADILETMRTK